jgi:hypothetical protein
MNDKQTWSAASANWQKFQDSRVGQSSQAVVGSRDCRVQQAVVGSRE